MGRFSGWCLLFALASCAAAGWQPPRAAEAARVQVEVAQAMTEIAADLGARGQIAWLDHFAPEPGFFMAADGALQFRDLPAAQQFLSTFAPSIAKTDLLWSELRVEPLGSDLAMVSAKYAETLVPREGARLAFGGWFTAVFWRTSSGWKIGHCHWSSPPPSR